MWYGGGKKERYCAPNDSTIIQRGAAAALTGPQDCVAEMRSVYQHRRDLAVNLLKELGRYVYTPHGAFYILVDVSNPGGKGQRGRQFALDLLRAQCCCRSRHNFWFGGGTVYACLTRSFG